MVFILIYSILTTSSFCTKLGVFVNDIFVELNTKRRTFAENRHNKTPVMSFDRGKTLRLICKYHLTYSTVQRVAK